MSLQLTTDKQLIDSYLSGSHSSLEVLIHRHKRKVYSYLLVLAKDQHLAEDLFQDVFIKVVHILRTGEYKDEGKFVHWVLRIAHNLSMDYFRKAKRLSYIPNKEDRDIFDTLHIQEHSVEEKLVVEQIHKNLRTLMEFLPPEQKEMIIMRHYYDMSFKEIADELDISISTATGRMRHALTGMRKLIQRKDVVLTRK